MYSAAAIWVRSYYRSREMLVLDLLNRSTQRAHQSQEFPQNTCENVRDHSVCRGNQAHAGANYGWQTAR